MPSFLGKILRLIYISLPYFFSVSVKFVTVIHDTCSTSSLRLMYSASFLIYYFNSERHLAVFLFMYNSFIGHELKVFNFNAIKFIFFCIAFTFAVSFKISFSTVRNKSFLDLFLDILYF